MAVCIATAARACARVREERSAREIVINSCLSALREEPRSLHRLMLAMSLGFHSSLQSRKEFVGPSCALACPQCAAQTTDRGRGLLFTYFFGSAKTDTRTHEVSQDFCGIFLRSFLETSSPLTDLVIMHESTNFAPGCAEVFASKSNVVVVRAPPDRVKEWSKDNGRPVVYRFMAFDWYLRQVDQQIYAFAGTIDADMLFQRDVFDVLFSMRSALTGTEELHVISEDEVERSGDWMVGHEVNKPWWGPYNHGHCKYIPASLHGLGLIGSIPIMLSEHRKSSDGQGRLGTAMANEEFWKEFGKTECVNVAHVFGTIGAMRDLMWRMAEAQRSPLLHNCMDAAIFAVIVWSGALSVGNATTIVWDDKRGLVTGAFTGFLRDRHGRFLNELGTPFAMVHGLKRSRSPKMFQQIDRMLPHPKLNHPPEPPWKVELFPNAMQRVPMDDNRYRNGTHPRAFVLAKRGMLDRGNPSAPLPKIAKCGAQYESLGALGPMGVVRSGDTWRDLQKVGMLAISSSGVALDWTLHASTKCGERARSKNLPPITIAEPERMDEGYDLASCLEACDRRSHCQGFVILSPRVSRTAPKAIRGVHCFARQFIDISSCGKPDSAWDTVVRHRHATAESGMRYLPRGLLRPLETWSGSQRPRHGVVLTRTNQTLGRFW